MPDYPTDHDAERLVLSCLMRAGGQIRQDVAAGLTPSMFDRYGSVAKPILRIAADGRRPDADTVRGAMESDRLLGDVLDVRPAPSNASEFAERVQVAHAQRRIQALAGEAHTRAHDGEDWMATLDRIEKRAVEISRELDTGDTLHVSDILKRRLQHHEDHQGEDVTGVPTPMSRLSVMTGGWQPSALTVIAARPSMGKTGFAVACADRALKNGVGVALYSLEMSAGQLADRFLAHDGRVQMPPKSDEDWQLVARAAGRLQDRPLYIDDEPSLCPVALRQRLRRLTHEEDVGLVIVDYLQLLKTPRGSDASSRNESVGAITRELKLTAKELDLPILALAQLNRNVESRNPPRPALSDLRDSGEIEEHSDNVLMLYRPEYYGITNDDYGSTDGVGEIIVSKHRNGPTGTVRAAFVEKYAAWMELENHRSNGQPAYSNEPF